MMLSVSCSKTKFYPIRSGLVWLDSAPLDSIRAWLSLAYARTSTNHSSGRGYERYARRHRPIMRTMMVVLSVFVTWLRYVSRAVFPTSTWFTTSRWNLYKSHECVYQWACEAKGYGIFLFAQSSWSRLHENHSSIRGYGETPSLWKERRDFDW